jgi:hypothetical protein
VSLRPAWATRWDPDSKRKKERQRNKTIQFGETFHPWDSVLGHLLNPARLRITETWGGHFNYCKVLSSLVSPAVSEHNELLRRGLQVLMKGAPDVPDTTVAMKTRNIRHFTPKNKSQCSNGDSLADNSEFSSSETLSAPRKYAFESGFPVMAPSLSCRSLPWNRMERKVRQSFIPTARTAPSLHQEPRCRRRRLWKTS